VVVKPLPTSVPVLPLVTGASFDAQGEPLLVLDVTGLAHQVRQGAVTTAEPRVAQRRRILVIDDSVTTRMLEQSILESAGHEVDVATSAEEALVKVGQRAYGLFLVDVEMPGMDGFGFIAALRAEPQLAGIPAILVTSRNRPEDRQRGVAVGAQGYIVKNDFDQVQLLDMIQRLVCR